MSPAGSERTGAPPRPGEVEPDPHGDPTERPDDDDGFRRRAVAEECHVGDVRRAFTAWLEGHGATEVEIDDWALIISELVTNARDASPTGTSIEIEADRHGRRTVLRVRNHAAEAFHPRVPDEVSPDRLSGRGMLIADRLSDGLAFDVTEQVTVTCWKINDADGRDV